MNKTSESKKRINWAFLITLLPWLAQRVKRLPVMWETQVQSLGWEDPLEKEMATHFSILAWKIPQMEKPGRLQSMGSQRVRTRLSDFTFFLFFIASLKQVGTFPYGM